MKALKSIRGFTTASPKPFMLRQLFDSISSTYTYLLADTKTKHALIIDPVIECVARDSQLINELDLYLKYALNTHVHADHITGSGQLKERFPNCKSVISSASGAKADIHVKEGDSIDFGAFKLNILNTPGHTNGCLTYVCHEQGIAFTGDALLIRGCGRTDFQEGDASTLYKSVHEKIFRLPDHFQLYPAHDYKGNLWTTVAEEKQFNPRLTKTLAEFIDIMDNLKLPYPKMIAVYLELTVNHVVLCLSFQYNLVNLTKTENYVDFILLAPSMSQTTYCLSELLQLAQHIKDSSLINTLIHDFLQLNLHLHT